MFPGVLSSFQSLLAQPAMLAIGAGLAAGAVAGTTLVVTGTLPGRPAAQLTLMECPDAGRQVAQVKSGVAMLVTGRNADGSWVELYVGVPGLDRGWARTANLKIDTTIDTLPVVPCVVAPASTLGPPPPTPAPTPAPTVAPTVTATVLPSPTLAPTASPAPTAKVTASPKPTRTPKPTTTPLPPPPTIPPTPAPTADVFAPSVSAPFVTSPGAYINGSYYINADWHCAQPTATIHVTASDPSGLNFVRLYYRPPGGSTTWGTMYNVGGNTYEFVIAPNGTWLDGEIGLWAQAQDTHGNTSGQIPFHNPNSNTDISLYWSSICLT